MTKIIGLTGGIGSGKTMIANYIKSLGIPVYIADEEAKKLMKSDELINKIKNKFGNELLSKNKFIDRKKLAKLVFNNPEKLQILNSIVHPKVRNHFLNWLEKQKKHPFVIKEAAILFESGSYKDCDAVITVTAPFEIRIQRVLNRDKTNSESIINRMHNQWTDEEKIAKSDYVITNISKEETIKQVDLILKKLIIH